VDWEKSIEEFNELIVAGKGTIALNKIKNLRKNKKIPRRFAPQFSKIYSRLGEPNLSTLVLFPFIRESIETQSELSDDEKISYGESLIRNGAILEGRDYLDSVDEKDRIDYQMALASSYNPHWNFSESLKVYEKILSPSNDYQNQVIRLNLANCHINLNNYQEAMNQLGEAYDVVGPQNLPLLKMNILELSTQVALSLGNIDEAQQYLNSAKKISADGWGESHFLLSKWEILIKLYQEKRPLPSSHPLLSELRDFSKTCFEKRYFTIKSTCDFYEAYFTQDLEKSLKVYFASPFEGYRTQILKALDFDIEIPDNYQWKFNSESQQTHQIDYLTGTLNGEICLKPGLSGHKLFQALCTNLYHPHTKYSLHEKMFPGEYFNPNTSPDKIYKIIKRLKADFKKCQIPIEIISHKDLYFMQSTQGASILLPLTRENSDPYVANFDLLKTQVKKTQFTMPELLNVIGGGQSRAKNFLSEWIRRGLIQSEKESTTNIYRIQ
jgi:tetratricopeptide (TPR) repeat protein